MNVRSLADAIGRDLGHSLRTLPRRPAFTLAAVLTLALGIGATTAIFSVVYSVLLKPLPYPNAERLAMPSLALAVVLAFTTFALTSHAQTYTASEAMERAAAITAELEQASDCDLTLHGDPQLDETTKRWLIAYSGSGSGCEDAGAALQHAGAELDITFFRRPNADEVKTLIAKMRSSVRKGFACLISFRGEPRFNDESTLWIVTYYASGQQCDDAAEELERQGRELRVLFHRMR